MTKPVVKQLETEKMVLNFGPQHPSTHGTLRIIMELNGETVVKVNEGEHAPIEKLFRSLGVFRFEKGKTGSVTVGTKGTDGKYVIVDAIQFLPIEKKP